MGLDIWNPWHGCHKCSEGCRNCYMYFMDAYRQRPEWSDQVFRTGKFNLPLKKDRGKNYKIKAGQRIRVNMTSDTFLEEAEPWLPEFWSIIRDRPDVIFWILTKRVNRILQSLPLDWGRGYDNVALNISVENQAAFDARWPLFSDIPAKHKGLCCAPLIGPIDITPALRTGQLQEILAGGENYDDPRVCDFAWAKSLSDQCTAYRTNFCWYESGTNLLYNNHIWFWPRKADQSAIAYLAGLNRLFYDLDYQLRDPSDGHILKQEERYQRRYNLNHCLFCSNRMICNGCLDCGDCCAPVRPGSIQDVLELERLQMLRSPPCVYQTFQQN